MTRCLAALLLSGVVIGAAGFGQYPKERATLKGHPNAVTCLAFSPDSRTVASGSADGTIKLWDVAAGKEHATLTGHTDVVHSVAFSPDNRMVASGSYDGTIKLWELVTGKERATLKGHKGRVFSVSFGPNGKLLASASGDKTTNWHEEGGQVSNRLQGEMP